MHHMKSFPAELMMQPVGEDAAIVLVGAEPHSPLAIILPGEALLSMHPSFFFLSFSLPLTGDKDTTSAQHFWVCK